MHVDVNSTPEYSYQLSNVNSGATVDVWRVLLGNEINTHNQMLVRRSSSATNISLWDGQEFLGWCSPAVKASA